MINLCLVVIATQFSETKKRETAKMKAERAKFTSSSTLSSFTNRWVISQNSGESGGLKYLMSVVY